MRPVAGLQFAQDVLHVVLDRIDGDAQLPGDLRVGVAIGDEVQYLSLAVGQDCIAI